MDISIPNKAPRRCSTRIACFHRHGFFCLDDSSSTRDEFGDGLPGLLASNNAVVFPARNSLSATLLLTRKLALCNWCFSPISKQPFALAALWKYQRNIFKFLFWSYLSFGYFARPLFWISAATAGAPWLSVLLALAII